MNLLHRYSTKASMFIILLVTLTVVLSSCSDNSTGGEDESENKKTGFLITGMTPSNTYLVKYEEEMPTGTVDLSTGTDFQYFYPVDAIGGAFFMVRPDESGGFAKIVVNSEGEIIEEGVLPTVDGSSFAIKIKDENTGVYHDRNNPDEITVFDPSDLSIKGTIDMSAATTPAPSRYESFAFRDDLVFAPVRPNAGGSFDSTIVHIADVSTGTYVGTTSMASGQSIPVFGFGQNNIDEQGNIYVADTGNPTGTNPISTVLRIPAGSNEFDDSYDFPPAFTANPSNQLLSVTNGLYYHQNNKAYAAVATDIPQELLELVASVGGDPSNLSDEQIVQAFDILYNAQNGRWSELDLQAQTVTPLPDFPNVSPFSVNIITEINGKLYIPVVTPSENAYYEYDPSTGQSQKAFDVTGGELIGLYDLSYSH
ncbi:hypothetical protein [Rhodohalobacter sp. 614A]|uniref:hypothetical protein n=1 Tax=Rhodohalobacter sp. 614A TaxID=2908649 RepID=UPI001F187644|nr:hypothetical protein [Rhodohalobacter sp. 614A]